MTKKSTLGQVCVTLLYASLISAGLLAVRIFSSGSWRYSFLLWNLALAWIPLGLAIVLKKKQHKYGWLGWQSLVAGVLWLIFLPNSFYLISDFVHLHATYEVSLLYDAALISSFAFCGMALGYASLISVHRELIKKVNFKTATFLVSFVIALSSFAIYLGRYQRWNSWDVLFDPAGLLFDLSDQIINPAAHTQAFATTATFFVLLGSIYFVLWRLSQLLRKLNSQS